MVLSKRQKILVVSLAVSLLALVYDRLQLGSNPIRPSPAAGSVIPDAPVAEPGAALPTAAGANSSKTPKSTLTDRLEDLAKARRLDGMDVRDAFRPPEGWMPRIAVQHPTPPASEADKARRFAEEHPLKAILVGPGGSRAIVDDQCLRIGQELGGFELVSINNRSVVLVSNGVRVTLRLASEPGGGEGE